MKPLTEPEIRAAFVNCSKGEAKRANLPRNLSEQPWEDLDFLGWRDPQAPERAYLAAEVDGRLVAVALRCSGPDALQKKTSMCEGEPGRVRRPGHRLTSVVCVAISSMALVSFIRRANIATV